MAGYNMDGYEPRHKELLVHDTVCVLGLIIARKGKPIHIDELPWCPASAHWMIRQNVFMNRKISHNCFQMFVTAVGVEFLRNHGVEVDVAKLPPDVTDLELPATPMSGEMQQVANLAKRRSSVYVQHKGGSINQVWDLDTLPTYVRDTLDSGMLAIHNGELYGLSEMHLRGE